MNGFSATEHYLVCKRKEVGGVEAWNERWVRQEAAVLKIVTNIELNIKHSRA